MILKKSFELPPSRADRVVARQPWKMEWQRILKHHIVRLLRMF
jgi:hypothetical protein